MKKILLNTEKTNRYLDSLPKLYLVVLWARYAVMELPFSGKYEKDQNNIDIPLVYQYDDHNGTDDRFFLRKITDTTTGWIVVWTPYKSQAAKIAEALNNQNK